MAFTANFAVKPQMDSAKLNAWRKTGVLEVAIIGVVGGDPKGITITLVSYSLPSWSFCCPISGGGLLTAPALYSC